jgi:O-antigen/teichoic acid export membrane protein
MSLKDTAAAGIRWTALAGIISAGSELLRTMVVAYFLSAADFGLMAMVLLVIAFIQMYTDLGLGAAIIHRQHTTRQELSTLYWLNLAVGLLVLALVWLGAPAVSIFFREPRVLPLLRLVALVFVLAPIGSQFDILLQRDLAFEVLAIRDIIASLGNTLVAIAGCVYGLGVWALIWGFIANTVLRTVLLAHVGWKRFRPLWHFDRRDLKGYIQFGVFQVGERTANYLGQRLDQLLIGTLLGAQALGYYSFAFNLTVQPMYRINPILNKVAFPLFSRVQHDRAKLKAGYMKLVNFLSTVNAPLLIGVAIVSPVAVPLFFGSKWLNSIALIQPLCLVTLLRTIGNPVGNLLLAKGRADLGFKWTALIVVISVPVIYGGGKIAGAFGVAVGLLVLQGFLAVPSYFYLIRPVAGKSGKAYASAILRPISLAMVMGLAVTLLAPLFAHFSRATVLALEVGIGGAVYVILVRLFDVAFLREARALIFSRSKPPQLVEAGATPSPTAQH